MAARRALRGASRDRMRSRRPVRRITRETSGAERGIL